MGATKRYSGIVPNLLAVLSMCIIAANVGATPFSFTYNGVFDTNSGGASAVGEPYSTTFTLDNGGTSASNQVFDFSTDFVSWSYTWAGQTRVSTGVNLTGLASLVTDLSGAGTFSLTSVMHSVYVSLAPFPSPHGMWISSSSEVFRMFNAVDAGPSWGTNNDTVGGSSNPFDAGAFKLDGGTTAIPTPSTFTVLGLGLAGLGCMRRK